MQIVNAVFTTNSNLMISRKSWPDGTAIYALGEGKRSYYMFCSSRGVHRPWVATPDDLSTEDWYILSDKEMVSLM